MKTEEDFTDSRFHSPDDRVESIASILAAGVLRLHSRRALSGQGAEVSLAEIPPESDAEGLDVPDETVLSVHTS